jgi:hypothetical protein
MAGRPNRPAIGASLPPATHTSRAGTPTYRAVHRALQRDRGPASSHRCVDCRAVARDWSLDRYADGDLIDPRGCHYSTELDRYVPRCRPCHVRRDRARRLGVVT